MGTKLSVTTGARRFSLRSLAITAMLVAGFAITASGASAAPEATEGIWTVRSGQTLEVDQMIIVAHDLDTAYVYVDQGQIDQIQQRLGSNAGHQDGSTAGLDPFFYTNMDLTKTTHTVTLELSDATAGCSSFSYGANAFASPMRELHSTTGLRERGDQIFINDGETHPMCAGIPFGPFGDFSNFQGNVIITGKP